MMILDEPTTGLDYRECMQMMELITSLNGQGTTVLMVSHDMEVVLDFAKRVLVLSDGRLIADGETRETLARQPLLATASVLPPQICALALRLGTGFEGIFTVEEMLPAIEERCR
jgi:energy-coupling factor transport system ATP-binding protein